VDSNRNSQEYRPLTIRQLIMSDLNRYRALENRSYVSMIVMYQGITASTYYRVGHALWSRPGRDTLLRVMLKGVYVVLNRLVQVFTGISISPGAKIGPGLHINHFGGTIIGYDVVMGSNCNISHGVTIGIAGRTTRGMPHIGDRVFVGPGAKVLGKITVGDDAAIGANAVVIKAVPPRAVAVGVPARVISHKGSFEFVIYDGMEDDHERTASLAQRESPPSSHAEADRVRRSHGQPAAAHADDASDDLPMTDEALRVAVSGQSV
jgi:serine O-acetyltransferase